MTSVLRPDARREERPRTAPAWHWIVSRAPLTQGRTRGACPWAEPVALWWGIGDISGGASISHCNQCRLASCWEGERQPTTVCSVQMAALMNNYAHRTSIAPQLTSSQAPSNPEDHPRGVVSTLQRGGVGIQDEGCVRELL